MKRKVFLCLAAAFPLLGLGYRYLIPKRETLTVWNLPAAQGGLPALRVESGETILFQQADGLKLMGGVTNSGRGLTFFQYDPAAFAKLGLPYQVMNLSKRRPEPKPLPASVIASLPPGTKIMPGLEAGDVSGDRYFTKVTREEGETKEVVTYYDVDADGLPDFKRTPAGLFRIKKLVWEMTADQWDWRRDPELRNYPEHQSGRQVLQTYTSPTPASH